MDQQIALVQGLPTCLVARVGEANQDPGRFGDRRIGEHLQEIGAVTFGSSPSKSFQRRSCISSQCSLYFASTTIVRSPRSTTRSGISDFCKPRYGGSHLSSTCLAFTTSSRRAICRATWDMMVSTQASKNCSWHRPRQPLEIADSRQSAIFCGPLNRLNPALEHVVAMALAARFRTWVSAAHAD